MAEHVRGEKATCGECGIEGIFCDTPEGELLIDCTLVLAPNPDGLPILCCGRVNGADTHEVFCEECAEHTH